MGGRGRAWTLLPETTSQWRRMRHLMGGMGRVAARSRSTADPGGPGEGSGSAVLSGAEAGSGWRRNGSPARAKGGLSGTGGSPAIRLLEAA